MWLLQAGKENITEQVSGVGLFVFPPEEAIEVKDDYLARTILEHKRLEGLVEVPIIRDKRGVSFDIDTAMKNAKAALAKGRAEMVKQYIHDQREDRIRQGKPPLPPSPKVMRIIEEEGIDLAAEGINISGAGFKVQNQQAEVLAKMEKMESTMTQLMEQNALLAEQNRMLKEQIETKGRKAAS